MKNYKGILVWAVEIVGFLFAAFGGFLTSVAPPSEIGAPFSVGIVSVVVLILLLAVSAIARQASAERHRKRWIAAGLVCLVVAFPAAFLYYNALEQHTYWFPPNTPASRHIRASDQDLTDLARDYIARNPTDSCPACLELNLPSDQIWKPEAMRSARNGLLLLYAWMVVCIAAAIFCLIEANSPAATGGQQEEKQNSAVPMPNGEQ